MMPIAVRVLSGCFVLHRADFCSLCVLLSFSHTLSLAVCAVSSGVVVVLKVNKKQAIRQNVAKKPLKRGKKCYTFALKTQNIFTRRTGR